MGHPSTGPRHLERATVRPDDALPTLDEALLVADHAADLDNIARDAVFEHSCSVIYCDAAGKELDQVASLEEDVRVVRFRGCLDCHRALDKVERAGNSLRA